jgi:Calcineurin-like phosphoesterase
MNFSVLHITDLHRDLGDEVSNTWLLDSLEKDFEQFGRQVPEIMRPELSIVSGDLVYGVKPTITDTAKELERQYAQAEEFLIGLSDRFFGGNRERIIVLPGNHDVCFTDVMESVQKIEIPDDPDKKTGLVRMLFAPNSQLRWSWNDLCFFKITDEEKYRSRFRYFAATYERFYQGRRKYPIAPEGQFDVFDFQELSFCVVALNSCFNNDPFRRAGSFHPATLTEACRVLRQPSRAGWVAAAAWHHNLVGGPTLDDYLDSEFLQLLIDAGVSIGFHGHQHLPECFDERYRLGQNSRKMTIISASTLCAEPRGLSPGVPRSYNVVEIDTSAWVGRVHQRQMVNRMFNLPVWGPGHFINTNSSFFDFDLCKPLQTRSSRLDTQFELNQADKLLGSHQWREALDVLNGIKEFPLARPLLLRALEELCDARCTIDMLWPPQSNAEAVVLGGAVLDSGTRAEAEAFVQLKLVIDSSDSSVREISRRVTERRLK